MERSEPIVMDISQIEMRQDRNFRFANILFSLALVILHPISKRRISCFNITPLSNVLQIKSEMPAIIHKSNTSRIVICSLDSDSGIVRRLTEKSDILIGVSEITACNCRGSSSDQSCE